MAATITLSPQHLTAWSELWRAHAAVSGRVQEALTEANLPPLIWYQLLSALSTAEDRMMRMGDLANDLVITRGGLTKLLDRLVKAGLVERKACPTDRRVTNALLLPAGAAMLEEMRPVVDTELESAFAGTLSDEEAAAMAASLGRVQSGACSLGLP